MNISQLQKLEDLMSSVINSGGTILKFSEKIFQVGYPKTKEHLRWYSEFRLYHQFMEDCLKELYQFPVLDEESVSISETLHRIHETILHGIAVSVQLVDLSELVTQHVDNPYKTFQKLLISVSIAAEALEICLNQLQSLYDDAAQLWAQLPDEDEDEMEQEDFPPEPLFDHNGYIRILQAITLIQNRFRPQTIKQTEFFQYITKQLNSFAEGEDFEEFSFSLVLRDNEEMQYIEFRGDGICVSVTDAGHSFDPAVGGDSYTNWEYTIWNNGQDEGSLELDDDKILEMLQMGAQISIEEPEIFL